MAGGPEETNVWQSYANSQPYYIKNQLTLHGYGAIRDPTNEDIILGAVEEGRMDPEEAKNAIAALSFLAISECIKPVE